MPYARVIESARPRVWHADLRIEHFFERTQLQP